MYKALYRKWRPLTFDDVISQQHITETLKNQIRTGRTAHAYLFTGSRGTGKTTCAQLLAGIMAEKGISNAAFIMASRADIVGKYVGHTAAKVSELFEKARGGILFVDEAGFFLNESSGGFIQEAIKEFVRFMELYPDVTVIFAMYEREASEFLKLDEGLSSRISRMVEFEDFSDRELQDICMHMIREKGYAVARNSIKPAFGYIAKMREEKNFGNARDVRKLVESVIVAHSVRIHSGAPESSAARETADADIISSADVKRGIERLRSIPQSRKKFGFEYANPAVLPLY